jgi:hypothetical protein
VPVFTPTFVHDPIAVPPRLKVREPPVGAGETVAVRVNPTPAVAGLALDETIVTVPEATVCCEMVADCEASNEPEPEYPAPMVLVPTLWNWVVVQVAVPPETGCAVHPAIGAPLAVNSTVPVAFEGVTVAVNVTGALAVVGFRPDVTVVVDEALVLIVAKLTDPSPPLFAPRNDVARAVEVAQDEPPPPPAPLSA